MIVNAFVNDVNLKVMIQRILLQSYSLPELLWVEKCEAQPIGSTCICIVRFIKNINKCPTPNMRNAQRCCGTLQSFTRLGTYSEE